MTSRSAFRDMIRKRSVMLKRHATSVSLEEEFWVELKRMADESGISMSELIVRIDQSRGAPNLSSALRKAVLANLQAKAGNRSG